MLPIAGILIGGAMTATSLSGRRVLDELRDRHGEYEAALALGFLPRDAALEVCRPVSGQALTPALDQTRTVGLVTLPGAFVGVLLGGGFAGPGWCHPGVGPGRPAGSGDDRSRGHRRARRGRHPAPSGIPALRLADQSGAADDAGELPRAASSATTLPARSRTSALWVPREDVPRFIPIDRIFAPIMRAFGREGMSNTTDSERPRIAAAVIIKDGQVLMARRRVKEGPLSWQFPAGKVEPGESAEDAAVRETLEETGLTVCATSSLGSRVHPATGRTMLYVACDVINGTAHVADEDELAEVAWCDRATLTACVPHPFFGPVQEHLDANLR